MHINVNSTSLAVASQVRKLTLLKADNQVIQQVLIIPLNLTAEHAKLLLPHILPKNGAKVVLFILFFGANDATIKGTPQHVHTPSIHNWEQVPLETYASNLKQILTSPLLKQNNPNIRVLLITPPPICAYRWGDHDREAGRSPQRTAEHTALYAQKAKSVASSLDIPFVDLWTHFLLEVGWKPGDPLIGSTKVAKNEELGKLLPDGLHFSEEGNKLCFKLIFEKIKEVWSDLDPENMTVKVPFWDMEKDMVETLKEYIERFDR
jgi:lysophospholipase L1-like esterase